MDSYALVWCLLHVVLPCLRGNSWVGAFVFILCEWQKQLGSLLLILFLHPKSKLFSQRVIYWESNTIIVSSIFRCFVQNPSLFKPWRLKLKHFQWFPGPMQTLLIIEKKTVALQRHFRHALRLHVNIHSYYFGHTHALQLHVIKTAPCHSYMCSGQAFPEEL